AGGGAGPAGGVPRDRMTGRPHPPTPSPARRGGAGQSPPLSLARERGWGLLLLVVLAGLLVLFRQPLWDHLDLETKHRLIAVYSRMTARRVETADNVPTNPQVQNRIGVNVFLDQEVNIDDRRRSLEMIRAAGIGWVRQQIPWKDIERDAKGDYWDRKWNK